MANRPKTPKIVSGVYEEVHNVIYYYYNNKFQRMSLRVFKSFSLLLDLFFLVAKNSFNFSPFKKIYIYTSRA